MDPGRDVPVVAHHPDADRLVTQLYKHLHDAGLVFWENNRWRRTVKYVSADPMDGEDENYHQVQPLKPRQDGIEEARQFPEQYHPEIELLHATAYQELSQLLKTGPSVNTNDGWIVSTPTRLS